MVSVHPNNNSGKDINIISHFQHHHPPIMDVALPGLNNNSSIQQQQTMIDVEDASKKIRKPYVISKSRESWTEMEHDKFLEALHLFDRDWKKIEAFVGSKTVIQIRSHAQKYFLKVQKNGMTEHVPPPRPKRKASHPYPQKASKIAHVESHGMGSIQPPTTLSQFGYTIPNSSSMPSTSTDMSSWTYSSVPQADVSHLSKDGGAILGENSSIDFGCSSSNGSSSKTWSASLTNEQRNPSLPMRVVPDFAQVYNFIGSVFDPNTSGHLQKLKNMDPINVETALLLMRNLAVNLTSPEFEDHRQLLSSYDVLPGKATAINGIHAGIQQNAISTS